MDKPKGKAKFIREDAIPYGRFEGSPMKKVSVYEATPVAGLPRLLWVVSDPPFGAVGHYLPGGSIADTCCYRQVMTGVETDADVLGVIGYEVQP